MTNVFYTVSAVAPGRRYGRRHYLAAGTVDGAVVEAGAGRTVYQVGSAGEWDEPVGEEPVDEWVFGDDDAEAYNDTFTDDC